MEFSKDDLIYLKEAIESDVFQAYIAKPMKDYRREQQNNFFPKDLLESYRNGGRVEGVDNFMNCISILNEDLKTKIDEELE